MKKYMKYKFSIQKIIFQVLIIGFFALGISVLFNTIRPDGIDITGANHLQPSPPGLQAMDLKTFINKIRQKGPLIIDARPETEYNAGHIPGAINHPYSAFDQWVEEFITTVPPETEIITYCTGPGCAQAEMVGEMLVELGYENITIFPGGVEEWVANQQPMATTP